MPPPLLEVGDLVIEGEAGVPYVRFAVPPFGAVDSV
jgi:hypothetical protein